MAFIIEVVNQNEFTIFTFKNMKEATDFAGIWNPCLRRNLFIHPTYEKFLETIKNTFGPQETV